MLTTARALGGEVVACVAGPASLAESMQALSFDRIIHWQVAEDLPAEVCAAEIAARAIREAPQAVLASDAASARVILGQAAAALKAAIVASVRSLARKDGRIIVSRATAEGKVLEDIAVPGAAAVIYDGDDMDAPAAVTAATETIPVTSGQMKVVETLAAAEGAGLLTALRVIGVGMGLGSKENLSAVEELATALNAAIACTLPVCNDMRWLADHNVVGSSHSQIAPDLYIAAGISGAPNHLSGVRDAKITVAVNNDPEARIFKFCDYGIVGDMHEIVPALTAALQ
jgi:electron transfer flavoprotein alpha subunit